MTQVDELRATFEAAEDFGLDAEEIWATVQDVVSQTLFGRTADKPFTPTFIQERADEAWKDAELERITLTTSGTPTHP